MEWQSIETAPKDDGASQFLCYWPQYTYSRYDAPQPRIAIATHVKAGRLGMEYYHDSTEWDDYGLQDRAAWPTHWMPLPDPPGGRRSDPEEALTMTADEPAETRETITAMIARWRRSRAHTYASENADLYRGFDNGCQRCADDLERWRATCTAQIRALPQLTPPGRVGELLGPYVQLEDVLTVVEQG